MNRVKVEIITIGDEILIGQIVDTNSAWMATELNKCGFELAQITSVHDNEQHIIESLDLALNRADIVLFTGGIGPTKDDITKQTLCKYFNTKIVFEESVIPNIEQLFSNRPAQPDRAHRRHAQQPRRRAQRPCRDRSAQWPGDGGLLSRRGGGYRLCAA